MRFEKMRVLCVKQVKCYNLLIIIIKIVLNISERPRPSAAQWSVPTVPSAAQCSPRPAC